MFYLKWELKKYELFSKNELFELEQEIIVVLQNDRIIIIAKEKINNHLDEKLVSWRLPIDGSFIFGSLQNLQYQTKNSFKWISKTYLKW